jgi:hypothetical protein
LENDLGDQDIMGFTAGRDVHITQIKQWKTAAAISAKTLRAEVDELMERKERNERLDILLASSLRSIRTIKAMHILSDERLVEDLTVLSRTLIETVVTACYLQFAPQSEVDGFRFFFIVGEVKGHNRFEERFGAMESLDAGTRAALNDVRNKALSLTGRKHNAQSWTDVPVFVRAQQVDERLQCPLFCDLVSTAYLDAHAFVHGTPRSLEYQMQVIEAGSFNEDEVLFQIVLMLHSAALTLHALTIFIDAEHSLEMGEQLRQASNLLRT